jgi:hypothetical protein
VVKYCHLSGVPWLITGSGLDDWIYWRFLLQFLLVTITCNGSPSMTAQDSLHFLLDYECLLLYCDWLRSDSRISPFFYEGERRITHYFSFTNESRRLTSEFSSDSITTETINYVFSLYNYGANRIQITTPNGSSTIPCLSFAAETCVNSVVTLWFL